MGTGWSWRVEKLGGRSPPPLKPIGGHDFTHIGLGSTRGGAWFLHQVRKGSGQKKGGETREPFWGTKW